MRATATRTTIDALPKTPASDFKKLGWRGVMRSVRASGSVVVTNHDEPEAVILSTDAYESLMQALAGSQAGHESALDTLRRRFDERLAALEKPQAGKQLRGVMLRKAQLKGRVKAGTNH